MSRLPHGALHGNTLHGQGGYSATLQPAASHPLQQQPAVRNPWLAERGASSTSSGSAAPLPGTAPPAARRHRSRASSLASSVRPPPGGCCSPGVQLLCYLCLRAALLASLFGGAALAIAGAVLRQRLGVLLYIGALAALVSALLLAVQHRARTPRSRPLPPRMPREEAVPLQVIVTAGPSHQAPRSTLLRTDDAQVPEMAAVHGSSVSGVPWWRLPGRPARS